MFELPGAYLRDLVDLTTTFGVDDLLAGLPVGDLDDPATRVPLRVCEAAIQRAIERTHQPALAIHLGLRMRLSSHGFLGFAAMTAETVRDALELAVKFSTIRTSAIRLALVTEGPTTQLVIEERIDLGGLREFVVFALLVGIWQLGTELTGKPPDGFAECAFAAPEFAGPPILEKIRFDRPAHRLVFETALLDTKLKTRDMVATKLAIEQCERELASTNDGELAAKIRTMLDANPAIALPEVATKLRLSARTLKRRLADQHTTFSKLRDDLRKQRALLLVDNRALSIGEVATKLGYTELPNFTRAFRKWTGVTPMAYRTSRDAGRRP
ncbi:MAG TPA: AraC family transcriptional regulator ligand-binding domain-containing protein [Kofleriaceae bacterium]